MRTIINMLLDIRKHQLERIGLPAQILTRRLAEVGDMFAVMDRHLNQINSFGHPTELAEVMTTHDFTYAIVEFVQRQMVPGYTQKVFAFEPLVWNDTLPNWLDVTRYQKRAQLDDLEYVGEKGTPRPGSVVDATKRQYRVYRWEKQFDFSMEALQNDDLGYFSDTASDMGRSARRTLEKYVSRMYTNATSIARLVGLGVLYSQVGRLTSTRISEARMAFNQRVDARNEPINARLSYLVHHSGLVDTVRQIRASQLVPELATNAANVIAGDFIPIEDPYIAGAAPNLPWWCFTNWSENNIRPFVLARKQGMPGPMLIRRTANQEVIGSLLGAGVAVPPVMGDFETGNVIVKVIDAWGTYVDAVLEGNYFDFRGGYYSSGVAP